MLMRLWRLLLFVVVLTSCAAIGGLSDYEFGVIAGGDDAATDAGSSGDVGSSGDEGGGPLSTILAVDVSIAEGNEGTTEATFIVRLVPASTREVKVDYTTVDGTAVVGSDYEAASGTLTFPPGVNSQEVKVKVIGDRTVEPSETFKLTLSNPTEATLDTATATCTILDDDIPGLAIADVTIAEGNAGSSDATFTAELTAPFPNAVTVSYATQDGTAAAGVDYTTSTGTLAFAAGETKKSLVVKIAGDTLFGPDKTFFVTLFNATGAPIVDGVAQGTITNDDPMPSLSINDVSQPEASSSAATFTVTLSAASSLEVTVAFATGGGTAGNTDYSATTGTLTFAPGTTTKTISVATSDDTLDEADETFDVTLSSPVNATIAKATGVGTIVDDDLPPTVSIEDLALVEGNAGTTTFTFKVTLSAPSGKQITVDYATVNGDAVAGTDFTAATGTVTFAPGETTKTFNVSVIGDLADEGVESFGVNLQNVVNATLAKASAVATILNDDAITPNITINDPVGVTEGNAGTTTVTFTLSVSAPNTSAAVTVNWATADGTATAASGDYAAASGTVIWPKNDATPKTITVTINGDSLFELDETFFVNLTSPSNGNILDAQGKATIVNDDTRPTVSIAGASALEGSTGTSQLVFQVTLSAVSGLPATVAYATSNGSAIAGSDYSSSAGTLTFAPGETTKTIGVSLTGETVYEPDESFTVTLSTPTNATIAVTSAPGTILNDDPMPSVSVNDIAVAEGNTGNSSLTFTISMSAPSSQSVTVNYNTVNGTAIAGSDYTAKSGSVTFLPGELLKTVKVTVSPDQTIELNEDFTLHLSSATGATILDADGLGTILNDD